jgi:hypothetical protein
MRPCGAQVRGRERLDLLDGVRWREDPPKVFQVQLSAAAGKGPKVSRYRSRRFQLNQNWRAAGGLDAALALPAASRGGQPPSDVFGMNRDLPTDLHLP